MAALADTHKEGRLAWAIRHNVHSVALVPPLLTVRLTEAAEAGLAKQIQAFLNRTKGPDWRVETVSEGGAATLAEQEAAAKQAHTAAALADPLVQAALAAFPDAEVESVVLSVSGTP